mmetsp:Transcript_32770/g.68910  ORF Transcript_32770/g.68910 Transcript_32770/m.68910 type:complete len:293 (-) Transcript_32770:261-1139(-)
MSQLPNKRQRGEDEVALSEGDFLLQQQLQVLLKADTDELAGAGRNDATILVELEKFNGRLEASLSAVKKARAAEETTRKEKERDIQNEMDKKAREEKTKQREGLVAGKHCFQCNVVRDELSPCVGYKHGGGVSGDGILSCDECMDKVMSFTCASCNSFMHQELGGSSCCDVNCHDDSYTCKSCEEVYCVDCVESGDNEGWTCECCDWYCKDCTDDNMATNECAQCSKKDVFCGNCEGTINMPKCEGECQELLCDDCVNRLGCGNTARLCGECEYDCEDCDMCAGYYTASRYR